MRKMNAPVRQQALTRMPLIIAHGLQCDSLYAAMLIKELPSSWPTMGLAAIGLNGDRPPLTTIKDMARHFVLDVQNRYGRQPCILAGFCAGGHISIEMAKQMRDSGGRVAHIYLLDTPRLLPQQYFKILSDQQVDATQQRLITHPAIGRYYRGAPATVSAFVKALKEHEHSRIDFPTTILGTTEMLPLIEDRELGWPSYLASDTRTIMISSSRDEFVSSGVAKVAAYLMKSHPPYIARKYSQR